MYLKINGIFFFKGLVSLLIIVLTGVAMFCSSWFSYIYIAEVVHFDSWEIDSELLVQQTYRAELYDAKDYAHAYRVYLENSLGEKILMLENLADELSKNEQLDDLNMDWNQETSRYEEPNNLVGSYMIPVIDAMENAMKDDSTQNSREQAAIAIEDAKEKINSRKEAVNQRLEKIIINIENYNASITDLTRRINSATAGTDTTSLENSLNNTIQLFERETENRNTFQTEYDQLDTAFSQLQIYESRLGLNNSASSIAIKSQLLEMQTEFFEENPDEEKLLNTAESIFKNLRNAATYGDEDSLSYMNLLVQMNQLILNLKDYSGIKKTESNLESYINMLASEEKNIDIEEWKKNWHERLEKLKSEISSMPIYAIAETSANEESSLTDSQHEMLQDYSRNESSKRLDDMIRLYIADHNALYQGIIYLNSPYNGLAWFSLVLAFSFDISGFIIGFVNQGETEERESHGVGQLVNKVIGKENYGRKNNTVTWSILPTLNKYRILTGDYEKRDNTYNYKVFEDGLLQMWNVDDVISYKQGIYVQDRAVETKGTQVPDAHQEILFYGQLGGPQDGIYLDCSLKFNEGSLLLVKEVNGVKDERFLVNLYEYVPVHSYSLSKGESQSIPAQDLSYSNILARMAVLALNNKGSRIAAIYILKE